MRRSRSRRPPLACGLAPIAAVAAGGQFGEFGQEPAGGVEQLLGLVAFQPGFELLQMLGILLRVGQRHLMGAEGAFDLLAVDDLGAGPALGRDEDDHRPARARWVMRAAAGIDAGCGGFRR